MLYCTQMIFGIQSIVYNLVPSLSLLRFHSVGDNASISSDIGVYVGVCVCDNFMTTQGCYLPRFFNVRYLVVYIKSTTLLWQY